MDQPEIDVWHMRRALELAARGEGHVEPNPLVGCVIAHGAEIVGEGWHRRYGDLHAETDALRVAGARARGATLYVTLEPCRHFGKQPPCTQAIIAAGVRRVVAAQRDPFPQVAGGGIAELLAAGLDVETGVLEADARWLNAPYLKLLATGRPWIIAKWAMTLDGKLAAGSGDSRWISGEESRSLVHALRGRVDAILVGRRTAAIDNPLLTARPPGPRTAVRIVCDSRAELSPESQLVATVAASPVVIAAGKEVNEANAARLRSAGCEVLQLPGDDHAARLENLLDDLGRRRMTNVLVEGGGGLLGTFFDRDWIDEVHAFIAPKLIGGHNAPTPWGGTGRNRLAEALRLDRPVMRLVGADVYISGRIARD